MYIPVVSVCHAISESLLSNLFLLPVWPLFVAPSSPFASWLIKLSELSAAPFAVTIGPPLAFASMRIKSSSREDGAPRWDVMPINSDLSIIGENTKIIFVLGWFPFDYLQYEIWMSNAGGFINLPWCQWGPHWWGRMRSLQGVWGLREGWGRGRRRRWSWASARGWSPRHSLGPTCQQPVRLTADGWHLLTHTSAHTLLPTACTIVCKSTNLNFFLVKSWKIQIYIYVYVFRNYVRDLFWEN